MLSVFLPTFQCISVLQIFIQHPFLLDTGKQRIYHSKPDIYSLCIGYLFSPRNCLRKEPNSVPWEIHAFSSHYLGENPHYRNLNLWPSINTVFMVLLGAWLALWYSFIPHLFFRGRWRKLPLPWGLNGNLKDMWNSQSGKPKSFIRIDWRGRLS